MTFEVMCWICAEVIAVIGIIMSIVAGLKPAWVKMVGIFCILMIVMCIAFPFFLGGKLNILTPMSGSTINKNGYVVKKYGTKNLITIPLTINSLRLPGNKFVSLITSDSGGTKLWVNSGSVCSDVLSEKLFKLDNATFGEISDGKSS